MPGPGANPMQPFLDAIAPVIADEQGWVAPSLPRFIQQTLLQRYSKEIGRASCRERV